MAFTNVPIGGNINTKIWEPLEISLEASGDFVSPYTEVSVWIDLTGPAFRKRVYGFWNGGRAFCIRLTAPRVGEWTWFSNSNTADIGLNGRSGRILAEPQTADDVSANPNRRGMIGISADGRGLQYADGTPFFLIGDTWWSVPTFKFPLPQGERHHAIGPDADVRDYLEFRRGQGYNCVALLAAMPAWATDGFDSDLYDDEGTLLRNAWRKPNSRSPMSMHNEGGRPFLFPGKVPGFEEVVPDYDRVNPEFFKILDRKMESIDDAGFVPFIEVARRDTGPAWKKYHDWPNSYVRYVQYVFARYQAQNAIFSPIHYDYYLKTIPAHEYNEPCNAVIEQFGRPPFGTLLSANSNPSTLANFGEDGRWLDLHQTGNTREHYSYWWMAEMYHSKPTRPALAGEPYYSGLYNLGTPYTLGKEGDTPEDDAYVRSGMYGSLLNGGYAGYIYGAEGIWQSAVEEGSRVFMWDAFKWSSGATVQHLKTFAFVRGTDYRALVPCSDSLANARNGPDLGYEGWAYAAGASDRSWYLLYFEPDCADAIRLRGFSGPESYRLTWFDPRSGQWSEPGGIVTVSADTSLHLPALPDRQDWGLMLERVSF
ncbi:DUF5060 domain-containing protein [Rhizobium sp. BK251]|uniref:DUF5060 domain-containing protein n=1 Tax=Rhizobium sp. BK251 TaxID=2512125 RepID=UPI001046B502|nr:DUF5060 domain-containing protein [Rhizobium sp. BK251]TCL66427.1 uncharacterized protein DUF5060 [Rhizobium sp. BK251]